MSIILKEVKFEYEFWLQVFGDHSRFILDSLGPSEKNDIAIAKTFKSNFDRLLTDARQLNTLENALKLLAQIEPQVLGLKKFKLSILEKLLFNKITFHLSPTFMNHMVNELEEFERIISYYKRKESPPIVHELHHHLLWLQDASGHAGAIEDKLDATEKAFKKKSAEFNQDFNHLYLKAVEFAGFIRTKAHHFPALDRMNNDIKLEIEAFQLFLNEILELEISEKILGNFPALMADHMFREECYYLNQLAKSSNTPEPECDPTSPRFEK
ncbi:DUF2935 domain-containing protein [Lederbergia lenta]|uniref:Domain of uncharacterized function (DUF2935) n=1 Tax=Lederbergia lenta TaxID=1467 RepID=A0A2X4ZAM7_LEDLE|nr:DUF2935 domain-containing protein [Lederbergia lenta]MCM3109425.1 DUF2935 domain-containing protein [Lederbergia lenta]MEC2324810.1 DUF2935 domain-containing protein [Lederbergia lenta]SQI57614.1 Domain of uncharacterised function (DUF2935) [Lederbergia lenta]